MSEERARSLSEYIRETEAKEAKERQWTARVGRCACGLFVATLGEHPWLFAHAESRAGAIESLVRVARPIIDRDFLLGSRN